MRFDHDASVARYERLSRMRGHDVAPNEADPRGWRVVNRDRRQVGEVRDLIVDTDRMVATHLDVELDARLFDLTGDDPHVLVPVDRAHAEGRKLVINEISPSWVSELRTARDLHDREFWDRWWHPSDANVSRHGPSLLHSGDPDALERAIDQARAGETVRIPIVEEEIVVERRQVLKEDSRRDEYVTNRAADETTWRER